MRTKSYRRPWGTFEILLDEPSYKVKRIKVEPSQRLSYQSHEYRSELWCVVAGSGLVTIDDRESSVSYGSIVKFPANAKHRMENTGEVPLEFIEVQTGISFEEEDIIRYEDDYKRV